MRVRVLLTAAFLSPFAGCASQAAGPMAAADGCGPSRPVGERPSLLASGAAPAPSVEPKDEPVCDREALEEEWPEPRPVVFLRGDTAPAATATNKAPTPLRVAQLERSARESQRKPEPGSASRAAALEESLLRLDADQFVRRCVLLDEAVLGVNERFQQEATTRTRAWVTGRLAAVQQDRDAPRHGLYAPSEAEVQAFFDRVLLELRADWVRKDRLRRAVDVALTTVARY
jgi:hypothetical protein